LQQELVAAVSGPAAAQATSVRRIICQNSRRPDGASRDYGKLRNVPSGRVPRGS